MERDRRCQTELASTGIAKRNSRTQRYYSKHYRHTSSQSSTQTMYAQTKNDIANFFECLIHFRFLASRKEPTWENNGKNYVTNRISPTCQLFPNLPVNAPICPPTLSHPTPHCSPNVPFYSKFLCALFFLLCVSCFFLVSFFFKLAAARKFQMMYL